MKYIGKLVTGDFEENTMTFEIEGEMTLQAGKYKIVQIEAGNQAKNNVCLADVSVSLIERAATLVGNPATNISGSTDLACDEWQKDYERWRNER
jgi:hypothetical protein